MRRIIHSRWFHYFVRFSRLQKVSRRILKWLSPTFRHGRITYRIRSPESFSVAREILKQKTYELLMGQADIRTVVDIGCNTGFFTCLLAERYGPGRIEGILVDADPDVLKECRWHLRTNKIHRCRTLCALVGPADSGATDFHIGEFNISSSARIFDAGYPFPQRTVKTITVPVVNLKDLIRDTFGEKRVHVMKIDIEGSEVDLLAQDLACLRQVDRVVIEWHKWVVPLDRIVEKLSELGFAVVQILKEDQICGLALFENRRSPSRALQTARPSRTAVPDR